MYLNYFISIFIYPVVVRLYWLGIQNGKNISFLGKMGFIDFVGSTVVHSVGAWVALAILIIIGPRTGRFSKPRKEVEITPSNPVLPSLGTILLWFGSFGFKAGYGLSMNTIFSGTMGGATIYIFSLFTKKPLKTTK